jgi:integrase
MAAGALIDRWYRTTKGGQRVKTDRHGQGLRYRARYRLTPTREVSRSFALVRDAQAWLAEQKVDIARGLRIDPQRARVTVSDWSAGWLGTKTNLKPTTRARYEGILTAHIVPRWGQHRLEDVQHAEVQRWVSDLAVSLSPATVIKVHRVLSLILALAVRDDRIARNPCDGCTLPRVADGEYRYLTHEQVHELADACGRTHTPYRLVVLFLAYTGLRWGEMAALRVRRVDPLRRRVLVAESVTLVNGVQTWGTPKGHDRRSVGVPRFLMDALAEHLAGKQPEDLVFPAVNGGALRSQVFQRAVLTGAAAEIGVPGLHPHELRHTAASLAIASGADVKVVQQMLGHKSATMTLDLYGHLFEDRLDDVADRLDQAVGALSSREAVVRELRSGQA